MLGLHRSTTARPTQYQVLGLWGRRDRGYKLQIQPLPEIGSSVARARQATFPNNFFDKSTENGGLSLFYLIIILQIDIINM